MAKKLVPSAGQQLQNTVILHAELHVACRGVAGEGLNKKTLLARHQGGDRAR